MFIYESSHRTELIYGFSRGRLISWLRRGVKILPRWSEARDLGDPVRVVFSRVTRARLLTLALRNLESKKIVSFAHKLVNFLRLPFLNLQFVIISVINSLFFCERGKENVCTFNVVILFSTIILKWDRLSSLLLAAIRENKWEFSLEL